MAIIRKLLSLGWTALLLLGLLLFFSTPVGWIQSYRDHDDFVEYLLGDIVDDSYNELRVTSSEGQVRAEWWHYSEWEKDIHLSWPPPHVEWHGFSIGRWGVVNGALMRWIVAPYWAVLLICSPSPLILLSRLRRRMRRRRRQQVGQCLQCGYDLRATPERCPECGTVPLKITACDVAGV